MKQENSPTRTILLLIVFVPLLTHQVDGQKDVFIKKAFIELNAGFAGKNGNCNGYGLQLVLPKNWMIGATRHTATMDLKNVPADYSRQSYNLFFSGFTQLPPPNQQITSTTVTVGKLFELQRSVFASAQAGVDFTSGNEYTFTKEPFSAGFQSSNYRADGERKKTTGGVIRADIIWAFTPICGLGFGGFGNFNSIQSYVGFEGKIVIGWMNRPKKIKTDKNQTSDQPF